MSREKTRRRTGNRQFLAFLLMVAFLVSALPMVWFARVVMAAEPLPESNNKVYHDNEYFELYHEVDGEVTSKKLEYLFAETIEAGTTRPVYCVMAGAPTPETGSIVPSAMNDHRYGIGPLRRRGYDQRTSAHPLLCQADPDLASGLAVQRGSERGDPVIL